MRTHAFVLGTALSLAMLAAAPLNAQTANVDCRLDFNLSGWALLYKEAEGAGVVSCNNGQRADVRIVAKGGGLVAGKYEIDDGNGEFSAVQDIREVFGTYAQAEAQAGAVKAGTAQLLTKGEVSLAIAGVGRGWDLGLSFGGFTIEPR